jgi:hypothetical protein
MATALPAGRPRNWCSIPDGPRRLFSTASRSALLLRSPVGRITGDMSGGPGFDCRYCQIFWVSVGLERGPHILVMINEELLE